jgi:hypothetical protein
MEEYSELLRDIGLSIIVLPLSALFTAAILRWLNTKIAKFIISFARAYRIEILVGVTRIGCYLAAVSIGVFIDDYRILNIFAILLIFLVGVPFYSKMIIHPDSGPIGWVKGGTYSIIFGFLDVVLQLAVTLIPLFVLSIIF